MSRLTVSIAICNYNYGRFLRASVDSALTQSRPALEVLVLDDGSTDDSRAILASYGDRIRTLLQPNTGQRGAYNALYAAARGEIIVFLDSDDRLHDHAQASLVPCFDDPGIVKVHWRLSLIDADGAAVGSVIPRTLDDGELAGRIRSAVFPASAPASGNAYRAATLASLFPLPVDARDRHGADFFCIYGAALLGRVTSIADGPLGDYRVHLAPEGRESFVFGNAATVAEPHKSLNRVHAFAAWVAERVGIDVDLTQIRLGFSTEKLTFAAAVMGEPRYGRRLRAGLRRLPGIVSATRDAGPLFRIAMFIWALLVAVSPRWLALALADHVCNPALRGRRPFLGRLAR